MKCPNCDRLSAYHDGELDAATRAEVQRHLDQCPACAVELAELSAMSQWFAQSPRPRLSQIALHRLHNGADATMQRDMLRLARFVQAIAACVLVSASIWLMNSSRSAPATLSQAVSQDSQTPAAPPWTGLAVEATAETNNLDVSSPAAAAYLADISSRSDDYQ
jgi:anti-sigma factor RsiW